MDSKTTSCPLHQMSPPGRLQVCCILGQKYNILKVDQLLTLHSYYMFGTSLLDIIINNKYHLIIFSVYEKI